MILFVFEGKKKEPAIFESLRKIYFRREESVVVCTYNTDFHSLYKALSENDWELFYVLRERLQQRGEDTLDGYKASDFSQIYLFFDYDFQNSHIAMEEQNRRLMEMLQYFNEETENGKLYINYPMVESIIYTVQLPDERFDDYVVSREDCRHFKELAAKFSHYPDSSFLLIGNKNNVPDEEVMSNWDLLKLQHVYKANLLCNGVRKTMPLSKDVIAQERIFKAQREQFVEPSESVSILNSFPIFVYEYLK
ncbi:MAG: hypothetical protein IJK78_10755 [Bacteroidales bacterium]|nr:hypothetical protein [Bacteroidales bacterium]